MNPNDHISFLNLILIFSFEIQNTNKGVSYDDFHDFSADRLSVLKVVLTLIFRFWIKSIFKHRIRP